MAKIIEYLQQAKEIADTIDNITLKSIIVDLQSEILNLQQENLQLKEVMNTKNTYNMCFENNVYYNILPNSAKEGPYCSGCWDTKKQAVRMHCRGDGYCCCPSCKREVFLESYSPFIGCSL